MMAGTEPVWVGFSAEVMSRCPPVGVAEEGIAAGTVLWGSGSLHEIGVPTEIVRECGRVELNVAEGDGEGGKFTIGGEPGSAISW